MPHRIGAAILFGVLAAPAAGAASVEDLGWLAGCWARDGREAGTGENWGRPAGGTIFGSSRSVRDGHTVSWEFLRIVGHNDGRIDYIASPSGQATTAFALQALDGYSAVFENPAHDFPQRIVYERPSPDRLLARIEGTMDGRFHQIEFPMTRIDCTPGDAGDDAG